MDISKPTHPLNLENLIEPFPKWIFGTFMFFLFYHFQNNTFHQYIELCNTESIDFINIFLVVNFSFSVNLIYFALSFRFHKRIKSCYFLFRNIEFCFRILCTLNVTDDANSNHRIYLKSLSVYVHYSYLSFFSSKTNFILFAVET